MAPLAVLAFSGARSGEIQRLWAIDVDLRGNWLKIESRPGAETKSGKPRKVPIHPRLRAVLETLPKRSKGYFFTSPPSKRYPDGEHSLNTKRLNELFLEILDGLEIPRGRVEGFTIHSLRHFMRTFAVNAGVPERVVDIWLGHATDRRSVQATYYHLSDSESLRFMKTIPFGDGEPAAVAGE